MKLILAELKSTDDTHMHEKHTEIKAKYASLVDALRKAGWTVHPEVASTVAGHRASALHGNKEELHILEITGRKDQQHTHNCLTYVAIRHAQSIINHTRRKRAALKRQRGDASCHHDI